MTRQPGFPPTAPPTISRPGREIREEKYEARTWRTPTGNSLKIKANKTALNFRREFSDKQKCESREINRNLLRSTNVRALPPPAGRRPGGHTGGTGPPPLPLSPSLPCRRRARARSSRRRSRTPRRCPATTGP